MPPRRVEETARRVDCLRVSVLSRTVCFRSAVPNILGTMDQFHGRWVGGGTAGRAQASFAFSLVPNRPQIGDPCFRYFKGGQKHLSWKTTVSKKIDLNLRILC